MAERPEPNAFGQLIRARRTSQRLSVREVARRAGLSPAYVSALELGRKSTAGRPSSPSLRVINGLAAALELDPARLMDELATAVHTHGGHALLYCVGPAAMPTLELVERLYGEHVDRWLYIADPRDSVSASPARDPRARICRWRLGEFPYPERTLETDNVVAALETEAARLRPADPADRIGIAIADNSAVMRWMHNADAEVQLEEMWDDHVNRIWRQQFGAEPAVNVCAYWHEDVETVGHAIDQVGTMLTLVRTHDTVTLIDEDGMVLSGSSAIRRMLEQVKPSGVTASSWAQLTDAASSALAHA